MNFFAIKTRGDKIFEAIVWAILIVLTLIIVYPLYYIIIASFSDPYALSRGDVMFIPRDINFEGYRIVFSNPALWLGYKNTFTYVGILTVIGVVTTMMSGFVLSRRGFIGGGLVMKFIVFTMLFGGGMVPTYLLFKNLRMIDTMWPIILTGCLTPYNIILTRTFLRSSVPESLYEAAVIDGSSNTNYFLRVIVPLSTPMIAVLALFYSVSEWNSYFDSLIYLSTRAKFPLQLLLREILIESQLDVTVVSDGAAYMERQKTIEMMKYGVIIFSSAPMMILYPFLQKYFVRGMMIGSIKE